MKLLLDDYDLNLSRNISLSLPNVLFTLSYFHVFRMNFLLLHWALQTFVENERKRVFDMRRKSINIVNRICMKFHFDISFFQKYFYGIFHIRCCDMRNMFRKSSFLLHYFPRDMLCQKVSLNVASTPTDKTFNLN